MFRIIFVLSCIIVCTSCFRRGNDSQELDKREVDSLRRLDSLRYLITPERIQKKDKFFRNFLDTTIVDLKIEAYQTGDVFKIETRYLCEKNDCDSIAKNFYIAEVKFIKNGKHLNTYYSGELKYSDYYSGYDYIKTGSLIFESPIKSFSPPDIKSLPLWHFSCDTSSFIEFELAINIFKVDSMTYRNEKIIKTIKRIKPEFSFLEKVKLKNYHYIVKELVMDTTAILNYAYDFGLFGDADLYYYLYSSYDQITSNTDEQFRGGVPKIRACKLFLREPKGELIMHLMDEDLINHDFLKGIHFSYGERDSHYVFKYDTSIYSTNFERICFSIKNPELKKPGFKKSK